MNPNARLLQNLEIVAACRKEIINRKLWRPPVVYLDPSCGAETPVLQSLVTKLGGSVAQSAGACLAVRTSTSCHGIGTR